MAYYDTPEQNVSADLFLEEESDDEDVPMSSYQKKKKRQRERDEKYRHALQDIPQKKAMTASFDRKFYNETSAARQVSKLKVTNWMEENQITIHPGYEEYFDRNANHTDFLKKEDLPSPIFEFDHIEWSNSVYFRKRLNQQFNRPTPIQSVTWPLLLSGYNVIGIAKTGSGKTLAFLLPAIVHLRGHSNRRDTKHPKILIILPTRELALQVEAEIEKFAKNERHVCVYGGASEPKQLAKIQSGVDIVVATPGRLYDYVQRQLIYLDLYYLTSHDRANEKTLLFDLCRFCGDSNLLQSNATPYLQVTFVVWDEADMLLDMGFQIPLDRIMKEIRSDKQMLMYSATWPKEVRKNAAKYLLHNGSDKYVVQVAIGSVDKLKANEDIQQEFVFFDNDLDKEMHLFEFLKEKDYGEKKCKILVFCDRKARAKEWAAFCNSKGLEAAVIQGNLHQNKREEALGAFRSGTINILFATNVVGRGIDIGDIDYVINFFMPKKVEEYVHRIGRTARAGKKGKAISYFVEEWDSHLANKLRNTLVKSNQEVPKQLLVMGNTKKKRPIGFADVRPQIEGWQGLKSSQVVDLKNKIAKHQEKMKTMTERDKFNAKKELKRMRERLKLKQEGLNRKQMNKTKSMTHKKINKKKKKKKNIKN